MPGICGRAFPTPRRDARFAHAGGCGNSGDRHREDPAMLPLEGVRVIEVGQALAGPLAGVLLADMGADVIKIEKPDGGDDARIWGPPFGPDGETSLYFYSQNRNKRSVTLDLKAAADVEKLNRLCETADILIQNLRPGVVDEIGRASCRERGVDLGGRRIIKKKKKK